MPKSTEDIEFVVILIGRQTLVVGINTETTIWLNYRLHTQYYESTALYYHLFHGVFTLSMRLGQSFHLHSGFQNS
ncbi:Uu.00g146480.m01.CDS01 [Anthostomella pinea]|uniref:Uu.00g146480.m01.CDS01 n=1 Tax=Anthostomella pinea TaxID=933095 RepID=A0AAI8VRA1_9PEZI|nr:Uu.00g146480.m01.CDS01 [Anthostomella pinea]